MIEPRVEEIFRFIFKELMRSGYEDLIGAGVVITGGSSYLGSVTDLAERVFRLPVRRANPTGVSGLFDLVNDPSYATAVGLVNYGAKYIQRDLSPSDPAKRNGYYRKMMRFFREFF